MYCDILKAQLQLFFLFLPQNVIQRKSITMTKPEETQEEVKPQEAPAPEGVDLAMSLMNPQESDNKSRTVSSEAGSSNSSNNNNVEGNNSDNSALVSVGGHSFGFNFDSDERNSSSPPNSLRNGGENDSDGGSGNGGDKETNEGAAKAEDQQGSAAVPSGQDAGDSENRLSS